MINPEKSFNIQDYVEVLMRRIFYIIIPFVVVMIGTLLYALNSPKLYRATTLILVTPQKVPEAFVRPTVTSKIEDRLQSIGQEIMSRTRLEQVIAAFKLYPEEAKSLAPEEIVELMRKNIQVEIKGREGYFTISYIGKDPRTVTMVTNKLASLFIEENLKLREQQAQGTSEFLSVELSAAKARLEEQEKTLTQFKKQFMGELPEQRDANLKVFEQFQLLYNRIGESLRAAQDRKIMLQKQLSDIELLLASTPNRKDAFASTRVRDPQETQLEQLKNQLIELEVKYTEKHPDIPILKKKIADLEAKVEEPSPDPSSSTKVSKSSVQKGEKKTGFSEQGSDLRLNPGYKETENQLIATELEIERLKKEEAKVRNQMNMYQGRIENTPIREQTMALLARDYQNTKEAYQSLLKKREEAQQAENLERRQKGEQFKVIDPARIPEKPFKPDIPKILLFGFVLGMGCGFGIAFFREQMDRSFRDAEDLETTLGFRVLANIPRILYLTSQPPLSGSSIRIRHELDLQKRQKRLVLSMVILTFCLAFGVSFIFWQEYLPITEWKQAIESIVEKFDLRIW